MSKLIQHFVAVAISLQMFFVPFVAVAQIDQGFTDAQTIASQAGLSTKTVRDTVISVVKVALSFVSLIAFAVLVYGGFLLITSAGDEDKAGQAKRLILYAVVGLLLIGLAVIIVNFIVSIISS